MTSSSKKEIKASISISLSKDKLKPVNAPNSSKKIPTTSINELSKVNHPGVFQKQASSHTQTSREFLITLHKNAR